MDFGSKFVYNYPDSEEEIVSEEELEGGLDAWTNADEPKKRVHGHGIGNARNVVDLTQLSDDSSSDEEFDNDYPKLVTHIPPPPPFPTPPIPGVTVDKCVPYVNVPPQPQCTEPIHESVDKCVPYVNVPPQPQQQTRQIPQSVSSHPPRSCKKHKRKVHKKSHQWLGEATKSKKESAGGKKWRRADTNVLLVKFGHLTSASNMHTGDPVYCNGCGAVLSCISVIQPQGEDKVWTCEYCSEKNIVDLEDEEIPKKDDVTFMLQPAPTTTSGGRSGVDESLVVFCIDVSGSMCVTTEVPGKVKLRGDHLQRLQSLNAERENQFMPGQRKNVTFVSRLQGVQAAVDFQLISMAKEHPNRRVALITFNNEVTVIGDGSTTPIHYAGDKLHNRDELQAAGASLELPHAIHATHNKLGDKVFDLEEGGQTALGPALLLSVAMASQVKGSKVIICTDGMANVGLGALDSINNTGDFDTASGFLQDVTQFASDHGVSVSVTTIKGTDCKLAELGNIAASTGGQVNIVDPLKLTQEFGNILADATIATNVQATLILHKGLYFRNELSSNSKITKQIGNVTKDTEITFEYGIKKRQKPTKVQKTPATEEQKEERMDVTEDTAETAGEKSATAETSVPDETSVPSETSISGETSTTAETAVTAESSAVPMDTEGAASSASRPQVNPTIDDLQELPFQLHLVYVDLDGVQAMRVLTQTKPITTDRTVAEKEMNPVLLGVHGTKQSAQMALGGEYTNSRLNAFMYQRLMYRNLNSDDMNNVYDCYLQNAAPIDGHIQTVQRQELRTRGHTYSDSSGDDDEEERLALPPYALPPPSASRPLALAVKPPQPQGMLSKAASFFRTNKSSSKPLKKKALVSRRMECSDDTANVLYSARRSCSNSESWTKKK